MLCHLPSRASFPAGGAVGPKLVFFLPRAFLVDQSTVLLRRSARHAEHTEHDEYDKPDKRDTHDEPPAASACTLVTWTLLLIALCTGIAGGRSSAVRLDRRQRRRRDTREPSWRDNHHPPQRERPVARDGQRFDGRGISRLCSRHLHGDGEARGLQDVHGRMSRSRSTASRASTCPCRWASSARQ